jgi:HAMP domain-containing protein
VRAALLATIVLAALALPSAAAAQGANSNPFSPGLPVSPAPTPTATTPTTIAPITTPTGGGNLGGGSIVAIAIGALVLLGGISFFIWRDARRRAPVRHRLATADGGGRPAAKRTKPRKLSPAERRRRKRGRAR